MYTCDNIYQKLIKCSLSECWVYLLTEKERWPKERISHNIVTENIRADDRYFFSSSRSFCLYIIPNLCENSAEEEWV